MHAGPAGGPDRARRRGGGASRVPAPPLAVDLFAGSGNTLYWIKRHAAARRAVGFELDDGVFGLTSKNISVAGLGLELRHESCQAGLRALGEPAEDLVIVFVAPPWRRALSEESGLDLRRTQPPVAEVIDATTGVLGHRKLLFAVQIHETVEPDSLAGLTARFPWSALKVYDINAAGQNHGPLLGTWAGPGLTARPARGRAYPVRNAAAQEDRCPTSRSCATATARPRGPT